MFHQINRNFNNHVHSVGPGNVSHWLLYYNRNYCPWNCIKFCECECVSTFTGISFQMINVHCTNSKCWEEKAEISICTCFIHFYWMNSNVYFFPLQNQYLLKSERFDFFRWNLSASITIPQNATSYTILRNVLCVTHIVSIYWSCLKYPLFNFQQKTHTHTQFVCVIVNFFFLHIAGLCNTMP